MDRLEDEGWSFIEVSGSVGVLVVGVWLSMTCSETLSSGTSCSATTSSGTGSEMRTDSRLVEEAITSSEAMLEAFYEFWKSINLSSTEGYIGTKVSLIGFL